MEKNKVFRYSLVFMLIVAMFSVVLIGVFARRNTIESSALQYGTETDYYSQEYLDSNHKTIFSLEKVYYSEEYKTQKNGDDAKAVMVNGETQPVYFYNIEKTVDSTTREKYVIYNDDYVLLSKSGDGKTIDGYEYKEYIMLSLGGYYLTDLTDSSKYTTNESVTDGGTNVGASLYSINITLTINGVVQQNAVPQVRQYTVENTTFSDFVWFFNLDTFTQNNGEAVTGYYKFKIMYGYIDTSSGMTYSQKSYDYGFYLLNQDDYEKEITSNGITYSTKPTIRKGDEIQNTTNTISIKATEKFPTLTYDYKLYTLQYVFDEYNTTHQVTVTYEEVEGEDYLVITSKELSSSTTRRYLLGDTKLVTLVFTQVGQYAFNFNYIYTGYLSDGTTGSQNIDDENTVISSQLNINGISLAYAKTGFYQADLRYYKIYEEDTSKVIVINGYQERNGKVYMGSSLAGDTVQTADSSLSLGVKYEITSTTTKRSGKIEARETADVTNDSFTTLTQYTNYISSVEEKNITRTNQAGLWFIWTGLMT